MHIYLFLRLICRLKAICRLSLCNSQSGRVSARKIDRLAVNNSYIVLLPTHRLATCILPTCRLTTRRLATCRLAPNRPALRRLASRSLAHIIESLHNSAIVYFRECVIMYELIIKVII